MNIQNLFPTPIGFFEYGKTLSEEELLFINSLDKRPNRGNMTSANNYVLRDPSLTSLRSFIEDCVVDYFKSVTNPKHNVNLRLTQSWFNYSESGHYHHRHAHPNSYISGVFYVQTNADDRIYFYRPGWQQIKFTPEEWNIYNSENWWFEATSGKLILFPSWLEHMVPTVQVGKTRISLSFNTFPVGIIGEEVELTGLHLEA